MIIPGFSRYDITEDGVVTNISTGKVAVRRCLQRDDKKYTVVNLITDKGTWRSPSVIRLLALAYLKDMPHKSSDLALPKDGDYSNTTVSNVLWQSRTTMGTLHYNNAQKRRASRCTPEAITLVEDAMRQLGKPTTMSALSILLMIPYSTVRYAIDALCKAGKVVHAKEGYVLK